MAYGVEGLALASGKDVALGEKYEVAILRSKDDNGLLKFHKTEGLSYRIACNTVYTLDLLLLDSLADGAEAFLFLLSCIIYRVTQSVGGSCFSSLTDLWLCRLVRVAPHLTLNSFLARAIEVQVFN
jgi:hypothetical protein